MKLDLKVDNVQGLVANLYARNERFQLAVRQLNGDFAEYTRDLAAQLAPKDTSFMSTKLRKDFSPDLLRWSVGYAESDFVGQVNPFTGDVITYPYFYVQELGSVDQEAQPHLHPAYEEMGPLYAADLSQLLRDVIAEGR